MFEITIKGRTAKISGLPIIRVPKGKVALVRNFHIINHNDNTNEVVKQGEISFLPYEEYDCGDNIVIDVRFCKFECK